MAEPSEKHHQQDAPPPPLGEALQWETPRPKRQSFLSRLTATAASTPKNQQHQATPAATAAAAPAAVATRNNTSTSTTSPAESKTAPDATTAAAAAAAAAAGTAGTTTSPPARGATTGLKARLDAILPPHRTYLNDRLSRRSLLLFVILPLLTLVLFVLPLAIGLGVGLSNKQHANDNIPLPPGLGGNGNNGGGGGGTDPGKTYQGELTYYAPGLGACGIVSGPNDAIVSVSHILFDAASTSGNPNANPLCGRKIRITRDKSSRAAARMIGRSSTTTMRGAGRRKDSVTMEKRASVEVTVVDRCEGCQAADLDLSLSVFTQLAEESEGRVEGTWTWAS